MPQHTEEFLLEKLLRDHTKVINQHHTKSGLFYYDPDQRKYIANAGERTKKRLQFLLENDRELKKALREDAEEMNLHHQSNYLDDDIQRLRRKRGPIKKLPKPIKYICAIPNSWGEEGNGNMVCCGLCSHWFHFVCINITQEELDPKKDYICRSCQEDRDGRWRWRKQMCPRTISPK